MSDKIEKMTDDDFKKIMQQLGMPESRSLYSALKQVENHTWQAARTVPEGSMVVSAKWLERHAGPEDHACVRCYPHSDMLVDGFLCYYHKALDVIAAAP